MTIELGKQYRTRDGREVRIYAVDGGGKLPVHGAIVQEDGVWVMDSWAMKGEWGGDGGADHHRDLIEVKPRIKRKVWVNIYRGRELDWMSTHDDRYDADDFHLEQRIACVEIDIDVEEGHGL